MQIHELSAQTTAADADVFAVDNGTATQKITVANLGKKVAEDAAPAFTSGDAESPTEWANVSVVTSGTALKTILNRITTMMKNVRWLYSKLGTTDISSIGGGTVTGALSKLNTDINQTATITPTSGMTFSRNSVAKSGKVVTIVIAVSGSIATGSWATIGTLPSGFYNTRTAFRTTLMFNPNISGFIHVSTSGQVQVYPGANITSLEANVSLPLN